MRFLLLSLFFSGLFSLTAAASPPNFWDPYTKKGEARELVRKAQEAFNRKDSVEVFSLTEEAREKGMVSAELALLYGVSILDNDPEKNAPEGIEALLAARELLPELEAQPLLRNYLAIYYALLGESARKAERAKGGSLFFREALKKSEEELVAVVNNPGAGPGLLATAWSNLGDTRMALYDIEGAIEAYRESLKGLSFGGDYTYFALAVALVRAGEERKAASVLGVALQIDPTLESLRSEGGVFFVPEEDRAFFLAVAFAGGGAVEMARYHLTAYIARAEESVYRQRAQKALDDIEGFCMLLQAKRRPNP